jgi:hypothetical protein
VVNPNSKEGITMAHTDILLIGLAVVVALLAGYDFRGEVETWDATRSEVRFAVGVVQWLVRGLTLGVLSSCAAVFFLGSGKTAWLAAGLGTGVLVVVVHKTFWEKS